MPGWRIRLLLLSLVAQSPTSQAQPLEPLKVYQPKVEQSASPVAVPLPPPREIPVELQPNSSIGIQEALQLAIQYQVSLQQAEQQVEAAAGRTQQAAAGLHPHLTASSTYTTQPYNSNLGSVGSVVSPSGFQYAASLNQLIFDFGHTHHLTEASEKQEEAYRQAYLQARSDLALQVKQAYYALLQAEQLVKVQQNTLANQQFHAAEARARTKAGVGVPSDVSQAETAVSAAQFTLSQAQTQESQARVSLLLRLGLDPRTPLSIRPEREPAPSGSDVQEYFQQALKGRADLAQQQALVESARQTLSAAVTTNSPTVGTALSYINRSNPSFSSVNLSMTVAFTPLDGGVREGSSRESEALLKQSELQLKAVENQVMGEVAQAYLNLKNAEQQVASTTAGEANAREFLRMAEGRYRAGLGLFLDVIDAQTSLLTAQVNRINAATLVDVSRATLARAIGHDPTQR